MAQAATIHGIAHTAPAFAVPLGATDCHVHVFGPAHHFPYAPTRVYTPGDASIEDLVAHHHGLGLSRVVVVQPSPYGADNACTLDAVVKLGRNARAVAVIDPAVITDAELVSMNAGGVCGVRANLHTAGVVEPGSSWRTLVALRDRVQPLGWHIQVYTTLSVIAALHEALRDLGVMLVIDHFGGAQAKLGVEQPGFGALMSLVAEGRAYVKLSAAYRASARSNAEDVAPLALALIAANPDRMLWGSDWPHPGGADRRGANRDAIEPFQPIDDGAALNRLAQWAGDATLIQRILVDNPARLYGF
jgi:predicted TIM-barrel fold metal-dependent hydrolase